MLVPAYQDSDNDPLRYVAVHDFTAGGESSATWGGISTGFRIYQLTAEELRIANNPPKPLVVDHLDLRDQGHLHLLEGAVSQGVNGQSFGLFVSDRSDNGPVLICRLKSLELESVFPPELPLLTEEEKVELQPCALSPFGHHHLTSPVFLSSMPGGEVQVLAYCIHCHLTFGYQPGS